MMNKYGFKWDLEIERQTEAACRVPALPAPDSQSVQC